MEHDDGEEEEEEEDGDFEGSEEGTASTSRRDKSLSSDMAEGSSPTRGKTTRTRSNSPQLKKKQKKRVISTAGQQNTRVFGRPFITAGWIVLAVAGVVATVEIGLLVLVFKVKI